MTKDLNIRIDGDEALVLFELLSRWSQDESATKPAASCFASPAEVAALLGILAQLERELVEPFQANYDVLLASARERLVSKAGAELSF